MLPSGEVAEANVEFEEHDFLAQVLANNLSGSSLSGLGHSLFCAEGVENFLLGIFFREKRGAFIVLEIILRCTPWAYLTFNHMRKMI